MDLLINQPKFQAFDASGAPLAGGKVYTYIAGTTMAKTTYKDRTLTTANTNPVELDSRGEAVIYCKGLLKIVLKDSVDVLIWTEDNIRPTDETRFSDDDGDTKIEVEKTPDEDTIRFTAAKVLQALMDITGMKLKSGTSINEFSTDATMEDNSDNAVPTEKAVATFVGTSFPGLCNRAKFSYKDTNEIYLNSAVYHHQGTTEQLVYWDSQLLFQFGSAGSNSDSDNLSAGDWFYVYLDDSAIVTAGTNVITASELLAVTEEPVWNAAKHGRYGSAAAGNATENDRCIFAVRTDGSSQVLEFFHDDNLVTYADWVTDLLNVDIDDTWTDVNLTMPSFACAALVTFYANSLSTTTNPLYYRTNGQTGTVGHVVASVQNATHKNAVNTCAVKTDSSQSIEVKYAASDASVVSIYTDGWYFPTGM